MAREFENHTLDLGDRTVLLSLIKSGRTPMFSRTEVSPIDGSTSASSQVNILIPGSANEQAQKFEVDIEEGRRIIELRDQITHLRSPQEILT